MANYVVLRRSPDLPTFDLAQTRRFCVDLGLDEDSIVDYAAKWNAEMGVDYLSYRQSPKEIALACVRSVRNATVIDYRVLYEKEIEDSDLLYFTDDDDWVSPDIFDRLRSREPALDGWIWPSLAIMKPFAGHQNEDVLTSRPISLSVYTNNYSVTGAALRRLGIDALLEHFSAESMRAAGEFAPASFEENLSAVNKHMCCTTFITRPQRGGGRLPSPRAGLTAYQADLARIMLDQKSRWLMIPLAALSRANSEALLDG